MILMESNLASIETRLVRLARRMHTPSSRLEETEDGLEFWSQQDGEPFLVRIANIPQLVLSLGKLGVHVKRRFSTEFWDINRFPEGWLRRWAILFNRLCFRLSVPPGLSCGNGLLCEKRSP